MKTHDVLIVGGGLVGASLACALDGCGLDVAMAEASAGGAVSAPPSFDERNLALAHASRLALDALGVSRHLVTPVCPIERIHVSSRGDFGTLRLAAADVGLAAFGGVVVARELGAALEARLDQVRDLQRYRPARVRGLTQHADQIQAELDDGSGGTRIGARLLVVADGTESELRSQLGIGVQRHDYRQSLFVATVQPSRGHAQVAYERFTESGPVALLPLAQDRCGSICTLPQDEAAAAAALDDAGYLELLQQRFGWRLGRFTRVGRRSVYPLQRLCADTLVASRAVLVGNAAQTIHPIGAQGFNLGLRDALTLADELLAARRAGTDPGDASLLTRYAQRRHEDRQATMALSDGLVRLFSNRFAPLRLLRSLGMVALDRVPGLRDGLITGSMGFRGDMAALVAQRDDAIAASRGITASVGTDA